MVKLTRTEENKNEQHEVRHSQPIDQQHLHFQRELESDYHENQ